jgi:electron transport complex protein RnfD
MSLPPWAPWWVVVFGNMCAIIIGKQLFGGIGQNVFNPAMLARVVLLVSFPLEMTTWIGPHPLFSASAPDFMQGLSITFIGIPNIDSVSSASILGYVKTGFTQGHTISQSLATNDFTPLSLALGNVPGSMGETSAVLIALGGLVLLALRIITWHIPVSMLATVAIMATIGNMLDPDHYLNPVYHLLSGGLILGAFFIATDMVTSPSTPKGQILFGAGCGVLDYVIRTWGGFPEGIGFAVMLMNAATPLIDHFVRPRVYGRSRNGNPLPVEKAEKDVAS